MMPAHLFIFKGMAKRISELAYERDKQLAKEQQAEQLTVKSE